MVAVLGWVRRHADPPRSSKLDGEFLASLKRDSCWPVSRELIFKFRPAFDKDGLDGREKSFGRRCLEQRRLHLTELPLLAAGRLHILHMCTDVSYGLRMGHMMQTRFMVFVSSRCVVLAFAALPTTFVLRTLTFTLCRRLKCYQRVLCSTPQPIPTETISSWS